MTPRHKSNSGELTSLLKLMAKSPQKAVAFANFFIVEKASSQLIWLAFGALK